MNWAWRKYNYNYNEICNNFLSLLLCVITSEPTPCMSKCEMDGVSDIGDWYVSPLGVYLRIYWLMKAQYMLPHYVRD